MQTLERTEIEVPFPEVGEPQLRVVMGGGRVRITPEAPDVWTRGAYYDPSGWLPCRVTQHGPALEIVQHWQPRDTGALHDLVSGAPELTVALGRRAAYPLTLEMGGTETHADLGGLPLTRLAVTQGAGALEIDFSAPNPQPMSLFSLGTGAGNLELHRLANANCAELTVGGGAAAYKLDFGGTLRRDMRVKVTGGMGAVEIALPATAAAQIRTESLLGHVDAGEAFSRRDGAFWTPAALAGGTPLLTISVSVALGSIRLLTF